MVCKEKEVDARTQIKHANDEIVWKSNKERKIQLAMIEARKFNHEGKLIVEITSCIIIISGSRYINF